MSKTSAPSTTPKPNVGEVQKSQTEPSRDLRQGFIFAVLNMSWQLAIVFLVPVIAGVEIDKAAGTKYVFTFVGLGLALIGSALVMWRAMQAANRLPLPKLTEAQKKAIRKSYEEDDKEE